MMIAHMTQKLRTIPYFGRLAFLAIFLLAAGCKDDPAAPAPVPIADPPPAPTVQRLQFPLTVGAVIHYMYSSTIGSHSWGSVSARREAWGTRTWEVTAVTGDSLSGTVAIRVTGRDTVIARDWPKDGNTPEPIKTFVVMDTTTFMTTYTADSMKVDMSGLFKTRWPECWTFKRAFAHLPDSVRVGFYPVYFAEYRNGIGLTRYHMFHTGLSGITAEELVFVSIQ